MVARYRCDFKSCNICCHSCLHHNQNDEIKKQWLKLKQQKKPDMSLYENINKRKKAGTSRSKKKSTISAKSYANMKAGFPKKKRNTK
jgi:hypothetical protein